jgi:hypothetical protein
VQKKVPRKKFCFVLKLMGSFIDRLLYIYIFEKIYNRKREASSLFSKIDYNGPANDKTAKTTSSTTSKNPHNVLKREGQKSKRRWCNELDCAFFSLSLFWESLKKILY